MTDDKTKKGFPDRALLNTKQKYEVRDFAEKMNLSQKRVIEVSRFLGTRSFRKIEDYLNKR